MKRQGQSSNKVRQLLKRDPRVAAGLCFLAACCFTFVYSLFNGHLFNAAIAGTLLLTNLIALNLIRKNSKPVPTTSKRRCRASIAGLFILFLLSPLAPENSARAQSPSPTPPTLQPRPTPASEAGHPSAKMNQLMNHVRELIPYVRLQIERPLFSKFKTLGLILTSLVLLFSFIKVIRENNGASSELYYWIARAAIFMFLFTLAPQMISTLYKIGRTLTIPLESGIEERRTAFNERYYEFVHGTYIIRDDKKIDTLPNKCHSDPDGCWLAILSSRESSINDPKGAIEDIRKQMDGGLSMDTMFYLLNISRGILQFGEIFLLLLGGFIMVALRLAAPFIIAVGTDKKLAERITYPFVWGTVVFTLVFPVVRDVITYIGYTVGAFGLMLYKGEAIYAIDERTAEIVKQGSYNPTFVIAITLVTMTISGLCLWLSPYIAYRIASGQVFEAVSSTASGWMAAIVGSAVEFAGLKAGASLQRQAENTQTQAGWQAEVTRAQGSFEASNLGAQARKISGLAQIQGALQGQLGAIHGGAATARGMALASQNFTVASVRGQIGDSNRQVLARKDQNVNQAQYQQGNESIRIASDAYASKEENFGQYFTIVPMGGIAVASQMRGYGITDRTRGLNAANNNMAIQTIQNENTTAQTVIGSQNTYKTDMETAAGDAYKENVAAINQGEGMAAGGAMRGAATARGGVNSAYGLEMQANEIQLDTTKSAAGIIRDGGYNAARLREMSSVITGVARDMDRRIEEGMRQRY